MSMDAIDSTALAAGGPAGNELGKGDPERRPGEVAHGVFRSLRAADSVTVAAFVFVGLVLFAAVVVPAVGLGDPNKTNLGEPLVRPFSHGHILGTDQLGRDMFDRIVWGTRPALLEGVLPVAIATALGALLGGIAGFVGGASESVAMRLTDMLLAIPPVMMGIAIGATLGAGLRNLVIAMTVVLVFPITRVARGALLGARRDAYILASRSIGVKEHRIFLRHALPNAAPVILAYSFSLVGIMIVFAAGLSFIGLGVQPPDPDWGRMVNDGRLVLPIAPWVSTAPGVAIFLVGLSFGVIGEAIDRRIRHR
jgi:peptide/nickel transport system permease protein